MASENSAEENEVIIENNKPGEADIEALKKQYEDTKEKV